MVASRSSRARQTGHSSFSCVKALGMKLSIDTPLSRLKNLDLKTSLEAGFDFDFLRLSDFADEDDATGGVVFLLVFIGALS